MVPPVGSRVIAAAICLLLLPSYCAHHAFGAEALVVPIDGAPFAATISALGPPGSITFSSAGGTQLLRDSAWAWFGAPAELAAGPVVLTADGGQFVADTTFHPLALKDEKLTFDTQCLGQISLPLRQVVGIALDRPARPLDADLLLDKLEGAAPKSDQVLLENGDLLEGTLASLSADTLTLEVHGRGLKVEIRNVQAILFNSMLITRPKVDGPGMIVGLSDGSRFPVAPLSGSGRLKSLLGTELKVSLAKITLLMPHHDGIVYLSDLEPAGYRHTPYLQVSWPYRRDRNVLGGQLRCGGQLYAKGLGMHSAAVLSYALKQPYRRFDAELGIDDLTHGGGSVMFRVYVDTGDGRWQKRFESGIVRGGSKPLPISVDLKGAKRVSLLVDYADRGDVQDHADWLNARLVP